MDTPRSSSKPHPCLKKPVIFIQRVPATVTKDDLLELFRKVQALDDATITLTKASKKTRAGEQVARVDFSSLDSAQKAMALLQFETMPKSSRSISFTLQETWGRRQSYIKPRPAVIPRLFEYRDSNMDLSEIYDVLRRYGPVFSIRVEEEHKTVSVVFWDFVDAHEAVRSLNVSSSVDGIEPLLWPVHSSTSGGFSFSPGFSQSDEEPDSLSDHETESAPTASRSNAAAPHADSSSVIQVAIPVPESTQQVQGHQLGCSLFCMFLPPFMDLPGFRRLFSKFGYITSAEIHNHTKRGYSHGLISFRNREDGLRAIDAMNELLVGRKKIVVRLDHQDGKINGGAGQIETEEQPGIEETVPSSNASEMHDEDVHSPSLSEDTRFDEPKQDSTTFSQSSSEATLTGSPTLATAEDPSSPKPTYSKVAQAGPPESNLRPVSEKPATILDKDTAQNISSLLSNIWKDEAERLRNDKLQKEVNRLKWENECLEKEQSRLQRQLDRKSVLEKQEKVNAEAAAKEIKRLQMEIFLCESREQGALERAEELDERVQELIYELEKQSEWRRKQMLELEADKQKVLERAEQQQGEMEKKIYELENKEIKRLQMEIFLCESREQEALERAEELDEQVQELERQSEWRRNQMLELEVDYQEVLERVDQLEEQQGEMERVDQLEEQLQQQQGEMERVEQLEKQLQQQQGEMEKKIYELERQLKLSESRRKMLELEADKPKWEEAKQKREQAEKEEVERRRRKIVEEARQRMREMEQQERKAREAKEAARLKKLKEEEERKKKEEEEKRRELEENLRKEKAWREATAKELQRCRTRDRLWTRPWNTLSALNRFKAVMNEFETQKFSMTCPMVLLSVPWPVLDNPFTFKLDQVEWDLVEKFFNTIQGMIIAAEYKALVERAHKMFHPDRWRSRNVLSSVLDEKERGALETAGNKVSQAITPIWRNLRK